MKLFLFTSLALIPSLALAWDMAPESKLQFYPVQSGSAFEASFTKFDAQGHIDGNMENSRFDVDVDVVSAETDFGQATAYFKLPVWFDSAKFPKAKFKSTSIRFKEGQTYHIEGDLTLKGITAPVNGEFIVQEKTNKRFVGDFTFNINRLAFNLGNSKEWGEGSIVDTNVEVKSHLVLVK